MRKGVFFWVVLVILSFQAGLLTRVQADVVGRMTQVEGRVDLLKGGKLPAVQGKVNDPVEIGDVLRTKSLSKAQITFMDNTVVTVSPESRLAVEDYLFDSAKGKRNAVLKLFQGLAHVVVSKVFNRVQPDFIVKSNTAVTGVRGTDFGVRLLPNRSTILNFQGITRVTNLFPEVTGAVELRGMQGTMVTKGLPPTLPFEVSPADRKLFIDQLSSGLSSTKGKNLDNDGAAKSTSGGGGSGASGTAGTGTFSGMGTTETGASTPIVSDSSLLSLSAYVLDNPLNSTGTTSTSEGIYSTAAANLVASSAVISSVTGVGSTSILISNLPITPPTIPPTPASSSSPPATPPPGPTTNLPPHPPR